MTKQQYSEDEEEEEEEEEEEGRSETRALKPREEEDKAQPSKKPPLTPYLPKTKTRNPQHPPMPPNLSPQSAAHQAVAAIGAGYDLCADVRLSSCKRTRSTLVDLDHGTRRDLVFPGGVVVADVPASIRCDKGERTRFTSDVLSFNQMSEQFNQALSLSGKIPCGLFNTMFNFKGSWQKDASTTKSLSFDGWLMTLYNIELSRTNLTLSEQVKNEVPSSWDPAALAEFIEKYGTHIIVGVKMGGKDVVHIKQFQNSPLPPTEVQKLLKKLADERFSEDATVSGRRATADLAESSRKVKDEHSTPWHLQGVFPSNVRPPVITRSKNNETESICVRRGGIDTGQSHNQWLSTVSESPNVISMSFVPITSLLGGLRGNGFLSHAVNLYLRYKPPIEELHQFLEFQLPRQWAPVYGDLPLGLRRKKHVSPSLQFWLMGPKLYVNITQVDSGNRPVTGIRLYLEGKKSDHLAIHLQHLTSLPTILQLSDNNNLNNNNNLINEPIPRAYLEPVKWSIFSHVCTSPVQYDGSRIDDSASIVTRAWLEVKTIGMKKVLFLKLGFSMVASARIRRSEWDGPTTSSRKSGVLTSMLMMSAPLYQPEEAARKVDLNSAVFAGGPPAPARAPRMEAFVETKEMARGPEDFPGYWVVTGAKLSLEGGKISTKVKFSLLAIMSDDSMMLM